MIRFCCDSSGGIAAKGLGKFIAKHIGAAMTYLNATTAWQQWVAHSHNHVFCAERSYRLMGP